MWTRRRCDSRAPITATPSPTDSIRMWEQLCDRDDAATTGHHLPPHPPQPIRSVASPPRSSLARARESACGTLVRRAPPQKGRRPGVGRPLCYTEPRRKPTTSVVGGCQRHLEATQTKHSIGNITDCGENAPRINRRLSSVLSIYRAMDSCMFV